MVKIITVVPRSNELKLGTTKMILSKTEKEPDEASFKLLDLQNPANFGITI